MITIKLKNLLKVRNLANKYKNEWKSKEDAAQKQWKKDNPTLPTDILSKDRGIHATLQLLNVVHGLTPESSKESFGLWFSKYDNVDSNLVDDEVVDIDEDMYAVYHELLDEMKTSGKNKKKNRK